ncbi:MAG: CotH kinase family protein [Bacteroidales bacterium]|nr:CotH kinase family protein [Bacteroidales bacterium]
MKKIFLLLAFSLIGLISSNATNPSGTLPVMYINIDNGQEVVTKEPYLNAKYWLDPNGQPGIQAFGSQDTPLVTQIKGRGNYTFTGFDKKPYRLKLDKKAALCGMKASKHFGLLAHADDNRGFLRNAIGFKVSEIVGLPWTPAYYPVELVINGSYRGLYFLTELIRIDSDRVNITKWQDEDANGNPLSKWIEGGTLVEIDNYDEPAQIQFNNDGAPEPLRFTYDKSVDPGYEPDGYVSWLQQSLGQVNNLILNGDRNSDELWNYVDIDDLARFIVVQEFMDNYESFHGSCYLFREKGDNEKWHFSPVWDFGSAFQRSHPNHSFYEQNDGNMHYNHWIGQLLEFPALRNKIADYWALLKNHRSELNSYASDFINKISSAAAADKQRWPQYGNDNLGGKLNEVMGYLDSATSFMNSEYISSDNESKDFYLIGEFNNWTFKDANYQMSFVEDKYVFDCPNGFSGKWKINNGSWDINFGAANNGEQPEVDNLFNLTSNESDITTSVPAGSTIIFKYNENGTSTLLIQTKSNPGDTESKDFYLIGDFNSWNGSDQSYKFQKNGNEYTFVCNKTISGKWKINDGSWNIDFGSSGSPLVLNENYDLSFKGSDFTTEIPAGSKLVFTYNPQGTSVLKIITDQPLPDFTKTVRFIDAHSSPWKQVYVWIWNDDNPDENFTGGKWPGAAMTLENNVAGISHRFPAARSWYYTFNTGKDIPNLQMVFSNGQDGDNNKTQDLPFTESYTRSDVVSSINDLNNGDPYAISASNGMITVNSMISFDLTVANLQGCSRTYQITPGITVINVTPGIYIVDNKKIKL